MAFFVFSYNSFISNINKTDINKINNTNETKVEELNDITDINKENIREVLNNNSAINIVDNEFYSSIKDKEDLENVNE